MAKLTNQFQRTRLITLSPDKHYSRDSGDDFRSSCRNVSHKQLCSFSFLCLTNFYDYPHSMPTRTSNSSLSKSALIGEGLIAEHMRCCKENVLLPSEVLAWWLRICLRLSCLLHSTRAAFRSPRVICCCLNCDVSTTSPTRTNTLVCYYLREDRYGIKYEQKKKKSNCDTVYYAHLDISQT